MSTLIAGQEVDDQCTKCKLFLAHTIVAMDGTNIIKVECKTCHSVHKYRGKKAKSTRAKAGTKKAIKVVPFAHENLRVCVLYVSLFILLM